MTNTDVILVGCAPRKTICLEFIFIKFLELLFSGTATHTKLTDRKPKRMPLHVQSSKNHIPQHNNWPSAINQTSQNSERFISPGTAVCLSQRASIACIIEVAEICRVYCVFYRLVVQKETKEKKERTKWLSMVIKIGRLEFCTESQSLSLCNINNPFFFFWHPNSG